MTRVGAVIVLTAVMAAIVGPMVGRLDPAAQDLALRLEGPTWLHWFGLDELGRDIFARVLSGARISLLVGLVVVSVSATVGTLLGSIAVLVLGFNFLGDGLRDALDPHSTIPNS